MARSLSPPGLTFISPEAEKGYKDRVPVVLPSANFPAYNAGTNLQTVMYDYDELKRAWLKFIYGMGPAMVPPRGERRKWKKPPRNGKK